MVEALHLGSLGLAALGASCAVTARGRGRVLDAVGSLVMLTAMIDAVAGFNLLPAVAWYLVMLTMAMASSLQDHLLRDAGASENRCGMTVHRNIGAILMAALVMCMEAAHTHLPDSGHHMQDTADPLGILLRVGSVAYLAASLWQACRRQTVRPLERIETATMGFSVFIMAAITAF